jgi:hypothetical protein
MSRAANCGTISGLVRNDARNVDTKGNQGEQMTAYGKINRHQMKRLQTLYGQLATHTQEGSDRASRMQWASSQVGHTLSSFADLTFDEAKQLIDGLQGQLGVKAPVRKRLPRTDARRAGLDGRKDGAEFASTPQVVTKADLSVIESYWLRLGWTRIQFDAWISSSRSPLRGSKQIRTTADANRVRWALKGMLVQKGLWTQHPQKTRRSA